MKRNISILLSLVPKIKSLTSFDIYRGIKPKSIHLIPGIITNLDFQSKVHTSYNFLKFSYQSITLCTYLKSIIFKLVSFNNLIIYKTM